LRLLLFLWLIVKYHFYIDIINFSHGLSLCHLQSHLWIKSGTIIFIIIHLLNLCIKTHRHFLPYLPFLFVKVFISFDTLSIYNMYHIILHVMNIHIRILYCFFFLNKKTKIFQNNFHLFLNIHIKFKISFWWHTFSIFPVMDHSFQ